ncbi:MAG TPA: FAD-dependent oxidoreductase [Candidatus Limnocylindrales bacterium]|nr:FAD-dependent oxidoreductase [Candidatus Limnocylindrales bacterium]
MTTGVSEPAGSAWATATTSGRPLRVAVVGAGPAGFYTVEALLKRKDVDVDVDLFERLPAPYGLLRYGVAPDHPKIKSVSVAYDRLCEDPRVRFFGNVHVGRGLAVSDLLACYDQVVFATGCETDRRIGVPGEELAGSLSATAFVAWYNGHPEYRSLPVDLSTERVVVVGIGDVAMDLARILLRNPDDLANTDIADYALAALRTSRVREVVILARRGPRQAAFAAKELEDIAELPGVGVSVDRDQVTHDLETVDPHHGTERHKLEVLAAIADAGDGGARRRLEIRFLASPAAILGEGGRTAAIRIQHNELIRSASSDVVARGTGRYETIPCGLVLRSVGYRGLPLAGLPFDEERGIIANAGGRVLDGGVIVPGLYVSGWIKRGATGVVGTNKGDAAATVANMLEDAATTPARDAASVSRGAIDRVLGERGIRVVTWDGWKRIDRVERERGAATGKVREKLTDIEACLEAAGV